MASGRNSRPTLLAPFQVRDFRCQFPADMLTSWGIEMETLILGWYILTETGSVLLLTVYSSLQYSGTLIAPLFGMAGDRFGHRNVLCLMRLCYACLSAVLMILAFTGALRPLFVMLIAGVNGLIRPSDLAMRQALVADIVPNEQLMAAMGVARTTSDSARIFGSLAGASLVAWLGIGPAYVAVTTFYSSGLLMTARITRRKPGSPVSTRGGLAFLKEVWEGVTYVRHRPLEMAGDLGRLPGQSAGISDDDRPAALRRQRHLPHQPNRPGHLGRQLRQWRVCGVADDRLPWPLVTARADDGGLFRGLVHAYPGIRANPQSDGRTGRPCPGRLRAKPEHDSRCRRCC